jgi:hypothetical protein
MKKCNFSEGVQEHGEGEQQKERRESNHRYKEQTVTTSGAQQCRAVIDNKWLPTSGINSPKGNTVKEVSSQRGAVRLFFHTLNVTNIDTANFDVLHLKRDVLRIGTSGNDANMDF